MGNLPPSLNSQLDLGVDDEVIVLTESETKLKRFILRKLGYPIVKVELTDAQIKDAIEEAIEEITPWVVQPEYITVDINRNAKVDVTKYKISYVINIVSANSTDTADLWDHFELIYPINFKENIYYEMEKSLVKDIHKGISGGISWKLIYDKHEKKDYMYIDMGYIKSKRVTIEYSPRIENLEDIEEDIYIYFIKKFALAFARETLVSIRGKYKVDGSHIELDAAEQNEKSNIELERLRQELIDTVCTHFMID